MADVGDVVARNVSDRSNRGIAAAVAALVRSGDLPSGARLPTVRSLATRLGVSVSTVAGAWRLLVDSQVITTRRRGGTVVVGAPRPPHPVRYERVVNPVHQLPTDLTRIVPDPALLPPLGAALAHAVEQPDVNVYTPAPVLDELREAVAPTWPFPAAEFLTVNGGYDGLALLFRSLLTPSDTVAIEEPSSPRLFDLAEAIGADVVPVRCDAHGPDPDSLRRAMQRRPVLFAYQTRCHSPTGHSVPADRVAQLADVLDGTETLVVENDSQCELATADRVSIGEHLPERIAHVRSYSKSHGPDLRLGMIGGASRIVDTAATARTFDAGWTSRLLQHALAFLLGDRDSRALVARARRTYRTRRDRMAKALAAAGVDASGSDGMGLWIPVRSENAAVHRLAVHGIAVQRGQLFYARESRGHHIRLSAGRVATGQDELAALIAAAAGTHQQGPLD